MAKTIIAHSAQEPQSRIERGRRLYAVHTDEIVFEDGVWYVPRPRTSTRRAMRSVSAVSRCAHVPTWNTPDSASVSTSLLLLYGRAKPSFAAGVGIGSPTANFTRLLRTTSRGFRVMLLVKSAPATTAFYRQLRRGG